ncbi:alpha/beta hydrolase [Desulfomicrobium escambiense]|uniref:alpha/beta hydrolase n=1 Tax=Desulfomicrobium escambiense TaxID=29503 RepID=UPI000423009A|nr:alpha/beta hydrolase [Desulfomicrobium escambiense]
MRNNTPKVPYDDPLRHRKTPREMLKEPICTECEACRDNIIQVRRDTIAVIFVPGIMGSKLKNPKNAPVWNPDDLLFMWGLFMWATPEDRYNLLIKNKPSLLNEITEKHINYPKAEERGWGSVAWSFYGDLLTSIQDWATPLKVLLDLPVYAFGYNWLESNRVSGAKLREFIHTIKAEKVILVTHSMGGLVARWALGGDEAGDVAAKVLGVVHGAQPVHGAPVAYRRMIAGQEVDGFFNILGMLGAKVLGSDGPSITAIFPHAESALELLPSQHYRTNDGRREWLHVQDPGSPDGLQSYPKGDPYREIYARSSHRDFWGMIHGGWFQPDPLEEGALGRVFHGEATEADPESVRQATLFLNRLETVRNFHATIGDYSHPRTMQLFSSGGQDTCSEVSWLARDVTLTVKHRPDDTRGDRDLRDRYFALRHISGILELSRGNYSEVRWIEADGTPGPAVPWNTPFEELDRGIKEGRRLFLLRVSGFGDSGPGMADKDICTLGDGTVPLSSATGLQPDCNTWGGATHTLPYWDGAERSMLATGCPTTSEHSAFFDKSAIQTTINTIHNLCLGWLRKEFN